MTKLKKWLGCAVGNPTYYCEVVADDTWEFPPAVYVIPYRHGYATKIQRCISYSARVWLQGSRGGVKIIKDHFDSKFGYITKDDKSIKNFMWAKLKARPLGNYT